MTTADIVVLAFVAGWLVGWLLNHKPPVIRDARIETTLVVDPKLLHQINLQMVHDWLDERGLVWQPKGAVYDPNRKLDK